MWFLIKGSLFFAAVLVVLSYFSNQPEKDGADLSPVQVADAVSAATGAYQYLSAICSEKPDVCVKGIDTISALGIRAREGAKVAFDILDDHFGDKSAAKTADAGQVNSGQVNSGQVSEKPVQTVALKADPLPQPMPGKLSTDKAAPELAAADTVFTGTVPVPQRRPLH